MKYHQSKPCLVSHTRELCEELCSIPHEDVVAIFMRMAGRNESRIQGTFDCMNHVGALVFFSDVEEILASMKKARVEVAEQIQAVAEEPK